MIPDRIVEEVRARADIVGIIGEFVRLTKAGKEFKGLSPFKEERTPSFFVVPSKAFFHDFSSGESGDVFKFLMKHQGMSFVEAVKFVGARSGVDVREEKSGGARDDFLRPHYEALAFAADFFRERLDSDSGKAARDYLQSRGNRHGRRRSVRRRMRPRRMERVSPSRRRARHRRGAVA